ncbi:hypothetical protein LSM04_003067 [Trypanosoma melophagium]|uniref:uncharacterized protein n=1 Tax=Trypanosoma melophagium TaxID=715481 RepID=UPI00351AA15B|nr:hypothetical protein LSM04_003067 [Trypanosoma melophagium]
MPSTVSNAAEFQQPEWELSSSSDENSISSRNISCDDRLECGALQERIERLLSNWEETTSRAIMKWGSIGVKSSEYTKIVHRNIIQKKQKEQEERELQKIRAQKQYEQKRREQRIRMAANFWARRRENQKGTGNHKFLNRSTTPPKELHAPKTQWNTTATTSCSPSIRQTHIAIVQKLRKAPVVAPITHTTVERHETTIVPEYVQEVFAIEADQLGSISSGKHQDTFSEKRNYGDQHIISTLLISNEEQQPDEKKESLVVEQSLPHLTASECEEATLMNESSSLPVMPVVVQTEAKLLVPGVGEKEHKIGGFEDDSFQLSGVIVRDRVRPGDPPHVDATNKMIMTYSSDSSSSSSSSSRGKSRNEKDNIEAMITAQNKTDEVAEHEMEAQEFKKDFPNDVIEENNLSSFDTTESTRLTEEEGKECLELSSIHSEISEDATRPPFSGTAKLEKSSDVSEYTSSITFAHSLSTVKEESKSESIYSDDFDTSSISENDEL